MVLDIVWIAAMIGKMIRQMLSAISMKMPMMMNANGMQQIPMITAAISRFSASLAFSATNLSVLPVVFRSTSGRMMDANGTTKPIRNDQWDNDARPALGCGSSLPCTMSPPAGAAGGDMSFPPVMGASFPVLFSSVMAVSIDLTCSLCTLQHEPCMAASKKTI